MKTRDHWRKEARKTGDPLLSRTYRDLRQEVNRFFVFIEKSTVNKIQSLANECDLTLNA